MTNDTRLTLHQPRGLAPRSDFDQLVEATLQTVRPTTQRVYRQTYDLWADFCSNAGIDPLDLRPANVTTFLSAQAVTVKTRKRQLSAMRKLARLLYIAVGGEAQRYYEGLKVILAPEDGATTSERERVALTPTQVERIFQVWRPEMPHCQRAPMIGQRNRALIALLFLTGMRRDEACKLKWSDIDLENCVVHLLGKGGKERDAAIFGREAIAALQLWRDAIPDNRYAFPVFDQSRRPGADAPMDGQTVYRIVKRTNKLSGVTFSPHTARRTFITEGLVRGAPLSSLQAQAGHARGETTLLYARPVDAKRRLQEFSLRYGD